MPTITAKPKSTPDKSYKIFIRKGVTDELPAYLKSEKLGDDFAIITDTKTEKLFGKTMSKFLRSKGLRAETISFTPGEKSKTLRTVEELAEKMVNKKFDRKDAILALGGGIVGDIAGFLGSIYMRGIPYIQIPTTLLAMVDSAIGGKTGVNLEAGKNLIGTITQPKAVFIDTKFLETLPENQIRNGLGEIIKCGVIADTQLFNFIEQNLERIFRLEDKAIDFIIKRSVEIKVKVIENDERELGRRMILNYGHTYGHALEKLSNYTLLHGYAISIGMVIANKIAIKKGLLKKSDAERIKNLLTKAGLPVTTMKKVSMKDLANDKKRVGNYINLILPTKIGEVVIYKQEIYGT